MTRLFAALLLAAFWLGPAWAAGGLEGFLSNLNLQARADLPGFSAKVSAQFGVPREQVQSVIHSVAAPADAFMVFQLGKMAQQPPDRVLDSYKKLHGQGWGVIAKRLGIKPGSPQFHALKRGDFALTGEPAGAPGGPGQGHGRGKAKGHGK